MNVNYSKLDDVRGEVTVSLEEKDYQDKVEKQLKEIAKTRQEPGFRLGHTPKGLIQKKYGKAVKYDVINKEVADAVFNHIKENNIDVLGQPVPEKNDDFNLDDKDFTFKFKVAVRPEFDTKVSKDLHVPYYNIEVSDKMFEDQDSGLRRRFGKQEPGDEVEPNALVKGVITELNEDGTVKEGGIVVENGIVSPQYFKSQEQRDLFVGKRVGDEVVFNPWATCDGNPAEMSSMLNIEKNDVENYKGNFRMDIKEIIVLRAAENGQEYFDMVFGKDQVHNEEEYTAKLKELIGESLKGDSNYRFTIDSQKTIMDAVGDITLADDIIKEWLMIQNEELTSENIDEEYARMRSGLLWELVSGEIAKKFDIKVNDEDVRNVAGMMVRNQLAQYGMNSVPDDLLAQYVDSVLKDAKQTERLARQAFDMKLYNAIRENVTLDEKDVNVEQFNDLFRNEGAAE